MVRDNRGGELAGATVRAVNQGGGGSGRAVTGADGSYTIADLAPGLYTVSVTLIGLRTVPHKDVRVTAGAATTVDVTLEPVTLAAVTVTAMLREQNLATVPISIAAPTEQALRLRGADNIEAIAANVAG